MANADTPMGLRPVRLLSGAPYNGQVRRVYFLASDGTRVGIGDPVKSSGTADADGVLEVVRAAAGDPIRGVMVAFEPSRTDLSLQYRAASTTRYGFMCEDKNVVYEVQEDSIGGALAATEIGLNADIVVTASCLTTSGLSQVELDSSGAASGTAQLRILGLVQSPDNEFGTNAKLEVLINEHELDARQSGV